MNKHYLLFIAILATICCSCNKSSNKKILENRIKEAIEIGLYNPQGTLDILDSIGDNRKLSKEAEMLYQIANIRAKYNLQKEIKQDTLILDAVSYFEKKQDNKYAGLANYYAAIMYQGNNNTIKEVEHVRLALPYVIESKDSIMTCRTLFYIGLLFARQEYNDSATTYYNKALAQLQTSNRELAGIYRSLAMINFVEYQPTNSLYNLKKANELATLYKDKKNLKLILQTYGISYLSLKKYDLASSYLHKYLKTDISKEDSVRTFFNLASVYLNKGVQDSTNYYIDKGLHQFTDIKYNYTQLSAYSVLMQYYASINDMKNYDKYSKLYEERAMQIRTDNAANNIMTANLKTLQKIEDKQTKATQIRIITYIISIFVLLFICTLIYLHTAYKRKEKIKLCDRLHEINRLKGELGNENKK